MTGEAKSKVQLEKEGWDAWWQEDYSWDGLAKKAWVGWVVDLADGAIHEKDRAPDGAKLRDASLQDYWREQESDLIASPDGTTRFTRVHLPLKWRDGTDTGKAGWADDALDGVLAPKLEAGAETAVDFIGLVSGADRRSQFQGAVLLRACNHPQGRASPVHLQAEGAVFVRRAIFDRQAFGPGARFNSATFSGVARFDSATFSGHAWFKSATFSGDAGFMSATFSGDAGFDSATFSDVARFNSATFSGVAGFDSATFSGVARFDSATFSGHAWFNSATFSGEAWFMSATFSGDAGFMSATFSGHAGFMSATFRKSVWFIKKSDDANPVMFAGLALFRTTIFDGPAQFDGAQFKGRMDFDTAEFHRFADFSGVGMPDKESDWRGGFDGALFEATLDARGLDLKAVSLFEGARFDRGVIFERIGVKKEQAMLRRALSEAVDAQDREKALQALESGALKLKHAMEAEKDYTREQRFHALELRARRKRKDTAWTEKAFSASYLVFARYGASIGLPFVWLAGAIAAFALVYWGLERGPQKVMASVAPAAWGQPVESNLIEAVRYSLSRVFPLGPWDESDEPVRVVVDAGKRSAGARETQRDCSFRERLVAAAACRPGRADFRLGNGEDVSAVKLELHRTFIALLSTLQTIFAGGLYFLFGLAVRRKFQIG